MATGRSTKPTGAVGEFLVAAGLCRRDLLATPFSGNVPHFDIIASGQFGGHVAIQVKATNGTTWQFDIGKFVEVKFDRRRQVPGVLKPEPYPGLVVVLVKLERSGRDHFFVLDWKELKRILVDMHTAFLKTHGGVRPKAPRSLHTALSTNDAELMRFKNRWVQILDRIANQSTD